MLLTMKQLEETFQNLLQDKISLEATMNAAGEVAEGNTCPECGHLLRIWHKPNGDSDYNVMAECSYCGSYFSE